MTISLRRFLTTSLIAIFISGVLTATAFLHSTNYSASAVNELTETVESAAASEKLQQSLSVHRRQALLNGLTTKSERRNQTEAAKKDLLQTSADLAKFVNFEEEKIKTQHVQLAILSYLTNFDLLRSMGAKHEVLYVGDTDEYNLAQVAIEELMNLNLKRAQDLQNQIANQNQINYRIVTTAMILLFIAIAVLLVGLNIFLFKPLVNLKKQIEDFEFHEKLNVIKISGSQEIKSIGQSFSKLAARLFKQKNLELTFLASVAHDIKNPLGAIKMSTELLNENEDIAKKEKELIGIIGRQTDQLFRLTNDLLDTTRIESGHLEIKLDKCDLTYLLQDAVRLHSALPGAKRIELQIHDKPLLASCDALRLAQVINNLLSNALKYSPDGGIIDVTAKIQDNFITITVTDNGVGIIEDDLEGIFEPFHRSNSTKHTIPGIGLGLSVSRKIMRAHHQGDLLVFSKAGTGSTFVIKLKPLELENPLELNF